MQFHAPGGAEIIDPWIEVAGHRFGWQGKLGPGQFVFLWPGEPVTRYSPEQSPSRSSVFPNVDLTPGEYSARFGSREPLKASVRVRITLQPPERVDALNE